MTREERRKRMPWSAALIDEHREFEPCGVWAVENGHSVSWPAEKTQYREFPAIPGSFNAKKR